MAIDDDDHDDHFAVQIFVIIIVGLSVIAGLLNMACLKVPIFTSTISLIVFLCGMFVTIIINNIQSDSGQELFILEYIRKLSINPSFFIYIVLPALLMRKCFALDMRSFSFGFTEIFFLTTLDLGLNLLISTLTIWQILVPFYKEWSFWKISWFCLVITFSEPTIMIKLLREFGSFKKFTRLIEGKFVVHLGYLIILTFLTRNFENFQQNRDPAHNSVGNLMWKFTRRYVFGPFLGYMTGRFTAYWLRNNNDDDLLELTTILVGGYVLGGIGKLTEYGGSTSIIVYTMTLVDFKNCLSIKMDKCAMRMLVLVEHYSSTIIYLLSSMHFVRMNNWDNIHSADYFISCFLFCMLKLTRGIIAGIFWILLRYKGIKTALNFNELCALVWCEKPESVCLYYAYMAVTTKEGVYDTMMLFHVTTVFMLSSIINGLSMSTVLKFLGFNYIGQSRCQTMLKAMKNLKDVRHSSIKYYRADRFLADADWNLVSKYVMIENPFGETNLVYRLSEETEAEVDRLLMKQFQVAPTLFPTEGDNKNQLSSASKVDMETVNKNVTEFIELDTGTNLILTDDILAMIDYQVARTTLFQAKKISFWKQYQHGMLSYDSVGILTDCIDFSTSDDDYISQLETIRKFCDATGYLKYTNMIKNRMAEIDITVNKRVRSKYRLLNSVITVYQTEFIQSFVLNALMFGNTVIVICAIVWKNSECEANNEKSLADWDIFFDVFNFIFMTVFSICIACKVVIFRRKYSKYFLNKVEIACFLLGWLDIFLRETIFHHRAIDNKNLKCYSESEPNKVQQSYKDWLLVDTVFFSARCLRAFLCAQMLLTLILNFISHSIQQKLQLGYDMGKGCVNCEDEVHDILDQIVDNPSVLELFKSLTSSLKKRKMRELSGLQRTHPGIVLSVKSKHAGRRILYDIELQIFNMCKLGLLDDYETRMFQKLVNGKMKQLLKMPLELPLPSPKRILLKTSWITDFENFMPLILNNSSVIAMAEGDLLEVDCDPENGLYIMVSGLMKLNMKFEKKSKFRYPKFDIDLLEEEDSFCDYMTTGSTLGELSLLTGQAFKTTAMCETTVQVIHIRYEAIQSALEIYTNPSLESSLWRICSLHVAFALLKRKPAYKYWSRDDLKSLINRGRVMTSRWVVPDGGDYQNEVVKFSIQNCQRFEIILVYGTALTPNLDEYVGPCSVDSVGIRTIVFQPSESDLFVVFMIPKEGMVFGLGRSDDETSDFNSLDNVDFFLSNVHSKGLPSLGSRGSKMSDTTIISQRKGSVTSSVSDTAKKESKSSRLRASRGHHRYRDSIASEISNTSNASLAAMVNGYTQSLDKSLLPESNQLLMERQPDANSHRVSITRSMFTSKDFAVSEEKSGTMPTRRSSTAWEPSSLAPSVTSEPTRRWSVSTAPTEVIGARQASFPRSDSTFKRLAELPESDSGTKINTHLPGITEHVSAHHRRAASTLLGAKESASRFVLAGIAERASALRRQSTSTLLDAKESASRFGLASKDTDNLSAPPVVAARRASRWSISNIPMAPVQETAAESPTHFKPSKYSPVARPAADKKD